MKKIVLSTLASAAALMVAVPAVAQVQVYNAPNGLGANQNWGGTLGLNFTVNAPVKVSALGVFDSGSDGLAAPLYATIFDSAGNQLFAPVMFASGTGSSGSAYLFQSVTPFVLGTGTYQVAAWGYNGEGNYNYGFVQAGNGGPITFNSVGGRLTAVSSSYSSEGTPGTFATIPDEGNTRYGAGSFIASAVPEPATWAMMMLGFGLVGFGLRSRRNGKVTTKVAYT